MIQRILGLLVLVGLGWLLGRLLRAGRPAAEVSRRPEPASPEAMVRDRVCNTFLPRSRAVVERTGEIEHFFCSDRCRRRFLEDTPTVS